MASSLLLLFSCMAAAAPHVALDEAPEIETPYQACVRRELVHMQRWHALKDACSEWICSHTLGKAVQVQLHSVPEVQPNVFHEIDTNRDGQLTRPEVLAWFKELPISGGNMTEGLSMGLQAIPQALWESEDNFTISWDEFEVCRV